MQYPIPAHALTYARHCLEATFADQINTLPAGHWHGAVTAKTDASCSSASCGQGIKTNCLSITVETVVVAVHKFLSLLFTAIAVTGAVRDFTSRKQITAGKHNAQRERFVTVPRC